ncbi:MAG: TMEM175 family protein [Dermatophilaceae bacterium]
MSQDRSTTPEAAKTSVDRLMFFSDAVLAIAMTLLAIDLPVPHSATREELFAFLDDHLGEYLAFLISFAVIALGWRGHHRLYRYVTDLTARLRSVNTYWLLMIVLTPFATRVLFAGEHVYDTDFPYRFGFYALVQTIAAAMMLVAARIIERQGLLHEDAPPGLLAGANARNLAVALTFLASIPVAFVIGPWAFVVWGLLSVTVRVAMRIQERRHPELDLRH